MKGFVKFANEIIKRGIVETAEANNPEIPTIYPRPRIPARHRKHRCKYLSTIFRRTVKQHVPHAYPLHHPARCVLITRKIWTRSESNIACPPVRLPRDTGLWTHRRSGTLACKPESEQKNPGRLALANQIRINNQSTYRLHSWTGEKTARTFPRNWTSRPRGGSHPTEESRRVRLCSLSLSPSARWTLARASARVDFARFSQERGNDPFNGIKSSRIGSATIIREKRIENPFGHWSHPYPLVPVHVRPLTQWQTHPHARTSATGHAHVCHKPTKDDLNYARPLTAARVNSPTCVTHIPGGPVRTRAKTRHDAWRHHRQPRSISPRPRFPKDPTMFSAWSNFTGFLF